ncbi:uncharacterized protein LOC142178566 [Nicotiana tabacum]|uniref:Uncharacterized protein LOC142178566 n=1 Tax=Nicotiana tabacum TaxID=4097 RepID=A0AC58U4R7_TOBAC
MDYEYCIARSTQRDSGEFDTIVPPPSSVKDYVELLNQQILLQFLGGLNDSYSQARHQILMRSTEPNLNQAYAMVIEDETQRGSSGRDSSSLNSLMEGNDITALWSAKRPQMYKPRRNFNIQCEFCKRKGHSKENCYQLIGYPTDFKGRRKPVTNSTHFGNSAQLGNHGQYQEMGKNLGNDLHTRKVRWTSRLKPDLYYWLHSDKDRVQASTAVCVTNEEELWHRRLGHIPHKILQQMRIIKHSRLHSNNVVLFVLGKTDKISFSTKYFLTLADDYNRMVWIFLFKLKSDVPTVIKDFMTLVKTQFNSAIKVFRSDNGTEFFNSHCTNMFKGADPTSEVSETALDSSVAPQPSPEVSSTLDPDGLAPEALQQSHLTSLLAAVMSHTTIAPLPLGWLNEFVHGTTKAGPSIALSSSYPMSAYMSYVSLSPAYFKALCSFSVVTEPTSYADALRDPSRLQPWMQNFDKRAIGCKWVFNVKYNAKEEVERCKARVVSKDYIEQEGLDYQETFSLMVKMVTVRTILSLDAMKGWKLHQMDVFNAFLQGEGEPPRVCKLQKSLYELNQASRQWNLKLSKALSSSGFVQGHHDYSLFSKQPGSNLIKDLEEMRYFLGLEVARSRYGILTCRFGSKPSCTPLDISHKLTSTEYDQASTHGNLDTDKLLNDPSNNQKLVRKLMYLTMTRPYISYNVYNLSQFMYKTNKSHMDGALRVVRYLKNEPGLGILLSSQSSDQLIVYCDADWATCPMTRRSVSGFVIKLGDSLISWKSKKQNTLSRNSEEAKYRSMANTITEVVWLTGLFKELNMELKLPVKLYCDSKTAI